MIDMATRASLKLYYRTTPHFRGLQELLKGKLRASKALSTKVRHTSSDALINAILLWAADHDPEILAKELVPYLARFKEVWDEVLKTEKTAEPWTPGAVRDL